MHQTPQSKSMVRKAIEVGLMIAIVVLVIVGTMFIVLHKGPREPIPEERAIAIIKAHVAKADNDPHEDIRIDNIELRPPTEDEAAYLRSWQKEPPGLMWFAEVTRFPSGLGPPPENSTWGGYAGMIWLDAYTGEVVAGTLLD